jgi:hypothetical protein
MPKFKISFARTEADRASSPSQLRLAHPLAQRLGMDPEIGSTCVIGRPLSSSSSGYFVGLDMSAENLLSAGQHPGSKDRAKPGPAQDATRGAPNLGGSTDIAAWTFRPDGEQVTILTPFKGATGRQCEGGVWGS